MHSRSVASSSDALTKRGELERDALQRVARLVDDEHVEHDVVLIDVHVRLGVDRIREARQLRHLATQNTPAASPSKTKAVSCVP